ncbi:MAG: NIL domain-containing protein, partial [Deferribacteraceae bacterium]|nr:NIL domain-containing protein [Deferribacteraceae bacterium]
TGAAREFISALKPIEEKETLAIEPVNAVRCRLHFLENVKKPILSRLIREFQIEVNILSGAIHNVGDTPVGELTADFSGQDKDIQAARHWLTQHGVAVEVVDV